MSHALARSTMLPLRPLFTCTILLGSFLLFLIQPMFGRSVLPLLGGAPAVWNTAMLFYQVTLLLGYLYAHLIRRRPIRQQLAIHLALFAVAALTLPVAVANWVPSADGVSPALWLLGLLAASIGPVFFVASAQAPLMQSWFARSSDPAAANPYFLYAASNVGSFAALIAYPLLVEPTLRLGDQSMLWSAGFVLLAVLVAACGLTIIRGGSAPIDAAVVDQGEIVPVSWRQRGRWTLLAFVASALLLSTTTHLTTDIMAMPLLWVIPLGVYLLSFIIAFGSSGPAATRWAVRLTPILLLIAGTWACLQLGPQAATVLAVAGILLLFVISLALHGTLSNERPPAGALTDFYLWISVGGALGGVLCALVAPVIFDWPYEHPLLLVCAAALVPGVPLGPKTRAMFENRRVRIGAAVAALAVSIVIGTHLTGDVKSTADAGLLTPMLVAVFFIAVLTILSIGQRGSFAFNFAMLMLALGGWQQLEVSRTPGARERSFFGVYTVEQSDELGVRMLRHGTTLHGVQSLVPAKAQTPLSYYVPQSGAGLVIGAIPALFGDNAHVAYLGLGVGTLSCFARPGQEWTTYEIDPVDVTVAQQQFSYLRTCRPETRIVVGDARLTLAAAKPGDLDVLIADAFASDSVPLHLMTREAFRVYGRALDADGVLVVHITNRFLDLKPVIAAIARAEGWTARFREYKKPGAPPKGELYLQSTWVVLTRNPQRMAALEAATGTADGQSAWQPLSVRADVPVWSDDFASILPVLRWRK